LGPRSAMTLPEEFKRYRCPGTLRRVSAATLLAGYPAQSLTPRLRQWCQKPDLSIDIVSARLVRHRNVGQIQPLRTDATERVPLPFAPIPAPPDVSIERVPIPAAQLLECCLRRGTRILPLR